MAPMPLRGTSIGLRAKFVLFFGLILAIACSALSWYYVEASGVARKASGTILLTNLVQ
jgi:hypothetical protein